LIFGMNFRKTHSIEAIPMQLAPLVDVLFLLVIFFAVTFQASKEEKLMDVSVPAAEEGKDRKQTSVGEIIINVKNDGGIVVNGQPLTPEELLGKLHNVPPFSRIRPSSSVATSRPNTTRSSRCWTHARRQASGTSPLPRAIPRTCRLRRTEP